MKRINIVIFKILVETISDESDQTPGMKKHTGIEVGTGAQQPAVVHFGLRCVHCSGLRDFGDFGDFMIKSPRVYCPGATQK